MVSKSVVMIIDVTGYNIILYEHTDNIPLIYISIPQGINILLLYIYTEYWIVRSDEQSRSQIQHHQHLPLQRTHPPPLTIDLIRSIMVVLHLHKLEFK